MTTLFEDVGAFHAKFDLPVARSAGGTRQPMFPADDIVQYRINFIREEFGELTAACERKDMVEVCDALADIVWVACGMAHYFGIPFDHVWAEVVRSNMEKRPWAEGDPVKPRAQHLKSMSPEIVKPEGWRPPDIDAVLDREASWFGS